MAAAKEFNVGKDTLVDFLIGKGFSRDDLKPTSKLTDDMYHALQGAFQTDKAAKAKSDQIEIPKGSLVDPLKKKRKEDEDEAPAKKDAFRASGTNGEEHHAEAPAPVAAPAAPSTQWSEATQREITPKEVTPKEITPREVAPQEAAIPKEAAPKEVPFPEAPAVREPVRAEAPPAPAPPVQPSAPEPQPEPPVQEKILKIEAPELEAPRVIKKIDLDALDSSTRPRKAAKKTDEDHPIRQEIRQEVHPEIRQEGHPDEAPQRAAEPSASSAPIQTAPAAVSDVTTPPPAEAKAAAPQEPSAPPQAEKISHPEKKQEVPVERTETPAGEVSAHGGNSEPSENEQGDKEQEVVITNIKAERLEGPKILGKIDLPLNSDTRPKPKEEKRKRKRIPLDKKGEPGHAGEPNRHGPGGHGGDFGNRPQGQGDRPRAPFNGNNAGAAGAQSRQGFNGAPGAGNAGHAGPGQNRGGAHPGGGGGQQNRGAHPPAPGSAQSRPHTVHQQRGGGGGGGGNRPGSGGGGGGRFDRRDNRSGPGGFKPAEPREINSKEIQDKIKETQAKLAGSSGRGKSLKAKYRKAKRDEMAEQTGEEGGENTLQLTEFISVAEFANLMEVSFAEVISKCMSLGIMVSINQRLDAEVIELVASEFGYEVEFIDMKEQDEFESDDDDDDPENLVPRAPIVTILGHVDHGKTSLLDYIRNAKVASGEAGGITQHIGAYEVVTTSGKKITFLDTPGHEAFTAMRARGAKGSDIAVIVIAADDAVMPQTREAISHAQAAGVPMIFAINKIDKEGANPEKIKEQLAGMNLLVEDWGGKYQSQEISAKSGLNIDLLLEKILLEAELLELKANPDRMAIGTIIEASLDKGRGYATSVLVDTGTLHIGDILVVGQHFGKVKALFNERNQRVESAGPSSPVQMLGLNGAPQAGEKFKVYEDESEAKEIASRRAQILREQGLRAKKHITLDEIGRRLALGNFKELNLIIKGDVDGSVEALSDSLQKLSTEEIVVRVILKGVGQITESDVLLATASDAIIVGFQVRPSMQASKLAEKEGVQIKGYSIIYTAIDEVKSAMEGMLEPKIQEKVTANVEIRETYKFDKISVAGCYVLEGKLFRNSRIRIVRDGIIVHTGELGSLKRFKDDAKEVQSGMECGLSIKNYNDMKQGDIIEAFEEEEVKRKL
jgi:translation initiation factor IF-2